MFLKFQCLIEEDMEFYRKFSISFSEEGLPVLVWFAIIPDIQ